MVTLSNGVDEFLQNGGKKVKNTLLLHDRIPPDQDLSFNTKAFSCGFSTIAHGEKQTTMLQCLLYTKSMRMYVHKERSLQLCSMPYIEMTRLNLSTRLPLERREVNEIKEAACVCTWQNLMQWSMHQKKPDWRNLSLCIQCQEGL